MDMAKLLRWKLSLPVVVVALLVGIYLITGSRLPVKMPELQAAQGQKPFDKPPEGQTFVGTKECASCHLDQFLTWKSTKHPKGFEILPQKYRADASCLACHSTGHGKPTGFVSEAMTPNLAGTTCEACHGPGSKHVEIAKMHGTKKLTDDESKFVRSSIYKELPKNVCATCHMAESHRKHPKYDK
jgi:mono/diheme cytochrome c family protein